MSASFELDNPDHFTVGAVGQPGQRTFYMQARQNGRLLTLKCEKEQVRALGEYLATLLERLPAAGGEAVAEGALIEPLEPAWAVRAIAAGYDADANRVVVEAREAVEEEEDDDEATEMTEAEAAEREVAAEAEGARARFLISRAQAAAFVERARKLMAAGRPECVLCSLPIDPTGHVCPRSNGHVQR